ncbi:uncharacterized protein KRP23_3083 [Phytophthora ramorum]|nr:hypothetical protein KRP23_3083 [Phytophthora ramorum]
MSPLLLLWFVASFGPAQAWLRGSDGRAQWDYECQFEGLDLVSLGSEPGSRCADLCLAHASCSHWTWTSEGCHLKQGATNAVVLHASHSCGFLPTRFAPDESQAFDLGLQLSEEQKEDGAMTDNEAETALKLLNSFRSKRGKTKLTLDAQLILLAHELSTTCRDVPLTASMRTGDGYELYPALPASVKSRGFTGEVHAVSVAAPSDSSVKHAIEWWTSGVDPKTGTKPFFSDDMAAVGFAKRKVTSCREHRAGSSGSSSGIVWTLLLAKSE